MLSPITPSLSKKVDHLIDVKCYNSPTRGTPTSANGNIRVAYFDIEQGYIDSKAYFKP